ncbi:MAG: tetratricopeptide repeat protein [Bacteroidota bacterium]
MSPNYSNISEYLNALEKYIGTLKSKEFFDKIGSGFSTQNSVKSSNSYPESFKLRSFIDRIITFTESKISPKKHINLLLDLSKLTLSRGELFLSSDILSQVLFRSIKHKELRNENAYAFMGLGEISSIQAKWDESFGYINKAKKIFTETNNQIGLASCDNFLGTFYAERGIVAVARKHFVKGIERLKGKRASNLLANILVNRGILEHMVGNIVESRKNYERALKNYKKSEDHKRIAQTLHNLGMLDFKEKKYKSAIEQFNKGIAVAEKDNNFSTLAISSLSIAHIYAETKEIELASKFIDKAMELSHQVNDRLTIADIYKVRGIIEAIKKNFDASENYLQTSLRINSELGNKINHAETSVELGKLYIEMNQKTKAGKALNTALKYYARIHATEEVKKIEAMLKN